AGRANRVEQRYVVVVDALCDVLDQVAGAAGDRPELAVAVQQPGNAVAYTDSLSAEVVLAVGHSGRRHRVRHEDDLPGSGGEPESDETGVDVLTVGDQLEHRFAACTRDQGSTDRSARAMMKRRHAVGEMGDDAGAVEIDEGGCERVV